MNKSPLTITTTDKDQVFAEVEKYMAGLNLTIAGRDASRPWGGFLVIAEKQTELFSTIFFPDIQLSDLYLSNKLSPKILLVQPHQRLSWQYHHRRAEIWRVVSGKAGVMTSDSDKEGRIQELNTGDTIRLRQGERHRLIGLDGWGIVAEIWQHTDERNPSDEADIVRIQDDFGR